MEPGWSDRDEAIAGELARLARSSLYRRPIALAGFMGVGKSTVGAMLSELLERPFYDTDRRVEEIAQRPVTAFFPDDEPAFRKLEADAVAELLDLGPSVIALGGGALLNPATRALLGDRSLLVHLHVPWAELRPDIPALVASRPLLQNRTVAEIHQIYLARLATYRQAALRVTVGRQGADKATAEVLRALRALDEKSRTAEVLRAGHHARRTAELDPSL